jgi:hypothetical protein
MDPHHRRPFRASEKYRPEDLVSLFLRLSPEERVKLFLPSKKVAGILGKAERTITGWCLFDRIAGIKVGERELRIYWPSVEDYLHSIQE